VAVSSAHLAWLGTQDITPTINVAELEWTLTAGTGVFLSAKFIREVVTDGRAAQAAQRNGSTQMAVEAFFLIGMVMLGLHILLLALGGLGMLAPTPPSPTPLYRVVGVAFTVTGELLVAALFRVNWLWNRLYYTRTTGA